MGPLRGVKEKRTKKKTHTVSLFPSILLISVKKTTLSCYLNPKNKEKGKLIFEAVFKKKDLLKMHPNFYTFFNTFIWVNYTVYQLFCTG